MKEYEYPLEILESKLKDVKFSIKHTKDNPLFEKDLKVFKTWESQLQNSIDQLSNSKVIAEGKVEYKSFGDKEANIKMYAIGGISIDCIIADYNKKKIKLFLQRDKQEK